MRESFFSGKRADFYRPLTRPWRGVVEEILVQLYDAFFGRKHSFSHSIERDELKSIVLDALQRIPMLTREGEEQPEQKDESTRANEIIRELVQHDYLDEYLDTVSMRNRFRFTAHGKSLARGFAEHGKPELRMPQRNVRNTRASLAMYAKTGDPADLFMAAEYAERIVHDFADAEASVQEMQRQVIAGASREFALTGYMDYIKKKFIPDHAVRASADSINRFGDEIRESVAAVKRRPAEELRKLEASAREARPDLVHGSESLVLETLDEIQRHLNEAMTRRMPSLIAAVGDFGDRASFVAIQASIVGGISGMSAIAQLGERLKVMGKGEQDAALLTLIEDVAPVRHGIVDESTIRLRRGGERESIVNIQEVQEETREDRRQAFVMRALAAEFGVSMGAIRSEVNRRIFAARGRQIRLSDFPVNGYTDLIMLTHAIEAGCCTHVKGRALRCNSLGVAVRRGPVEFEDMTIRPAK